MGIQRPRSSGIALAATFISLVILAGCPALPPSSGTTDSGGASIGVLGGAPVGPSGATHEENTDGSSNSGDSPAAPTDPSAPVLPPVSADAPALPPGAVPMYRMLPGGGPDQTGSQTPPIAGGVNVPAAIPGDTALTLLGVINACTVDQDPSRISVTLSGSISVRQDTKLPPSEIRTPFLRVVVRASAPKGITEFVDVPLQDVTEDPATHARRQLLYPTTVFVRSLQNWEYYYGQEEPKDLLILGSLAPTKYTPDPYTGMTVCSMDACSGYYARETDFEWISKNAPIYDRAKPECPSYASTQEIQIPQDTIDRLEMLRQPYLRQSFPRN